MLIKIPVSTGELIDKITILEIKKIKVNDKLKLADIRNEHKYLKSILVKKIKLDPYIKREIAALKKINLILWDIEDGKRLAEKNKNFDVKFIELARNVYKFNDERAKIKLAINNILGSNIKEVKSYY